MSVLSRRDFLRGAAGAAALASSNAFPQTTIVKDTRRENSESIRIKNVAGAPAKDLVAEQIIRIQGTNFANRPSCDRYNSLYFNMLRSEDPDSKGSFFRMEIRDDGMPLSFRPEIIFNEDYDKKAPRMIDYGFRNGMVSPDGRWLVCERNSNPDEKGSRLTLAFYDLFEKPPSIDKAKSLRFGKMVMGYRNPAWFPDGRVLAVRDGYSKMTGDMRRNIMKNDMFLVDPETREITGFPGMEFAENGVSRINWVDSARVNGTDMILLEKYTGIPKGRENPLDPVRLSSIFCANGRDGYRESPLVWKEGTNLKYPVFSRSFPGREHTQKICFIEEGRTGLQEGNDIFIADFDDPSRRTKLDSDLNSGYRHGYFRDPFWSENGTIYCAGGVTPEASELTVIKLGPRKKNYVNGI